jgi:hypothetical protein
MKENSVQRKNYLFFTNSYNLKKKLKNFTKNINIFRCIPKPMPETSAALWRLSP